MLTYIVVVNVCYPNEWDKVGVFKEIWTGAIFCLFVSFYYPVLGSGGGENWQRLIGRFHMASTWRYNYPSCYTSRQVEVQVDHTFFHAFIASSTAQSYNNYMYRDSAVSYCFHPPRLTGPSVRWTWFRDKVDEKEKTIIQCLSIVSLSYMYLFGWEGFQWSENF